MAGARCAGPDCHRQIERRPTGRPARYCSPSCRQAAHRARGRAAELAAARAARIAAAQATARNLLPALRVAAFNAVPDQAADVFACANDPGISAAELGQAVAKLYARAEELAELARDYREAADAAGYRI